MLPAVVVALRPSSSPVLARMNAPLHTDMVWVVPAFAERIQLRVDGSFVVARTPPPGMSRTSGWGASAKVWSGTTVMPIAVVTGCFDLATVYTWYPVAPNTSHGPV